MCACVYVVKNSTQHHHPTRIVFGLNADQVGEDSSATPFIDVLVVGRRTCSRLQSTSKIKTKQNRDNADFSVMEDHETSEASFQNKEGEKACRLPDTLISSDQQVYFPATWYPFAF